MNDDTFLEGARAWLLRRRTELRERVHRVSGDLGRAPEPLPRDFADAAIAMENDEVLEAIGSAANAELEHIRRALTRLDDGTFGSCERCGKDISAARLRVIPYATRCSACETVA